MSTKKTRIGMLIALRKILLDIGCDSANQDGETLKNNMDIISDHVADILRLDGVGLIPSDAKVGELITHKEVT